MSQGRVPPSWTPEPSSTDSSSGLKIRLLIAAAGILRRDGRTMTPPGPGGPGGGEMKKLNPLLCAAVLAFTALAPPAGSSPSAAADVAEIHAVTFTEANFAKYLQATRNLGNADYGKCPDVDRDDDGAEDASITAVAAKL